MRRAVVRLPSNVIERLDRLADELRAAHPEESFSRASVVRAMISTGLIFAETKDGRLDVARLAALAARREDAR